MAVLSDIEDRLLAMSEGDPVTVKLAQEILSFWYERKVGHLEIIRMVNRLAKLEFIRWRYERGTKKHFTKRLSPTRTGVKSPTFKATRVGELYLEKPREVV